MPVQLGSAFGSISLDLAPLRTAAAQSRASFGEMERAADAVRVTIVKSQTEITASMDRLKGSINLQQRQYQILSQEVEKAGQAFGQGSIQAQKKQLALDRLGQSIANNEAKLAGLEGELERTSAALATAGSGAGQTASRFNEMKAGVEQASQSLLQTGGVLSAGITAPLAMLGSQALSAASDYETAMNLFQANTGATAEQMARAGETAKALGADLSLPGASAGDAGEVMLELAKAGLSVDEALGEARGTMALAATEALDNAEAATIAAGAFNTFKAEGLKVAQVADMLASGSSASSASVRSLSQGLQQAGSSFAAAHIPMRDLVAQMSLMANAGIQGSDAGTSLKTMLQRLQGPTDKAADAMRDLGISIYDQQGAMRPMRDLVGQFSTSLAGLTQQERDKAIVTIFGADAQRAANIVLAGGVEAYDKMVEAVGRQGSASELAAARMKGVAGAIDGFKSTVETALLTAVEPFMGGIAGLINAASQLVGAFMALDPSLRSAAVAFAAVMAAAGPLMLAAGGLATAVAAVSAPLLLAATAVAAFVAALASGNPVIVGAAVAIAAYVAAQQFGALAASIPTILAQTAALAANAAAALAAAAPFVVLGAAVAGAVLVYQKWQNIASDAAAKVLADSTTNVGKAYQGATQALERYGQASQDVQQATRKQADELRQLQAEQAKDVQARADMAAQGKADSAEWQANTQRINERTAKMRELSAAIGENLDRAAKGLPLTEAQASAEERAAHATAQRTAAELAAAGDIGGALLLLQQQAGLTDEAIEKLGKDLAKAAEEGAKAFGQAVTSEVGFMADRESAAQSHGERLAGIEDTYKQDSYKLMERWEGAKTQKQKEEIGKQIADLHQGYLDKTAAEQASFAEQEAKAAEAYARQQAAQLAHLGKMLIDYTNAQATMAGIAPAKIAEMTNQLAAQYGVQQSLMDRSFGQMTQSIDTWVANGGADTAQYVANLGTVQSAAVTMQQEVDRQISAMTSQLSADFAAGKMSVEEYAAKLTRIPAEAERAAAALKGIPTTISSTVTITTLEKKVQAGGGGDSAARVPTKGPAGSSTARASGGPVAGGRLYEVAERGRPELLTTGGHTYLLMGDRGGHVTPAARDAAQGLADQARRAAPPPAAAPAGLSQGLMGEVAPMAMARARAAMGAPPAGPPRESPAASARARAAQTARALPGGLSQGLLGEVAPMALARARSAMAQAAGPLRAGAEAGAAIGRAVAPQADIARQAQAIGQAAAQAATPPPAPASPGAGAAGPPAPAPMINLTIAPTLPGAIIDTAERVAAAGDQIAATVRAAVAGDLNKVVDRLILGGGTR